MFPLQVLFTDESGSTYAVYITADGDLHRVRHEHFLTRAQISGGHFGAVGDRVSHHTFSMTDPRKKYPAVSDDNWDNITRGKVAAEMTRDECRLFWGGAGCT